VPRSTARYACLVDVEDWPDVVDLAVGADARAFYQNRVSAFIQYKQGASTRLIENSTGLTRQLLRYWLCRCSETDSDGNVLGWRVLVPYKHLPAPRRVDVRVLEASKPLPGSLRALFLKFPDVKTAVFNAAVHGKHPRSRRKDPRMTWDAIHSIFLSECTEAGIRAPHYPFNSERSGRAALIRWGKRERATEIHRSQLSQAITRQKNPWATHSSSAVRCYQDCSVDGHYVDIQLRVVYESLNGGAKIELNFTRLWLIAIIEEKSTAVLGYSIALGANYSAEDVTRALRSALAPWKPRALTVSTVAHRPGDCLPTGFDPDLEYVCFDRLKLDNALAHKSKALLSTMDQTVQAVPIFGARASPNERPLIERVFGLFEEAGVHVLDGTTGSSPKDSRRDNSKAVQYKLTIELLEDLIELLVTRYNGSICPGSTQTRLEILKHYVQRTPNLVRRVAPRRREQLLEFDVYEEAVIGIDGDEPLLRWRNARYYNKVALADPALVGKAVLVMCNSQDARSVNVALMEDGRVLGNFTVERRWKSTPHSLQTRTLICRAMASKSFVTNSADLPRAFRAHVEQSAKEQRAKQRTLMRLGREQVKPSSSPEESSDAVAAVPVAGPSQSKTEVHAQHAPSEIPPDLLDVLGSTFNRTPWPTR